MCLVHRWSSWWVAALHRKAAVTHDPLCPLTQSDRRSKLSLVPLLPQKLTHPTHLPRYLEGFRAGPVHLQSNQLHPSRGQQSSCLALPQSFPSPSRTRRANGSSPCSHLCHRGGGLCGEGSTANAPRNTLNPTNGLQRSSLSRCGSDPLMAQQVGGKGGGRSGCDGTGGSPGEETVKDSTPFSAEPPGTASHRDQGQAGRSWGGGGGQVADKRRTRSRAGAALRGPELASEAVAGGEREALASDTHSYWENQNQVPVVPRPTAGLEATWLLFITSPMKIPSLLKCLVHLLASDRSHQATRGTRIRTRDPPSHMTTSRL